MAENAAGNGGIPNRIIKLLMPQEFEILRNDGTVMSILFGHPTGNPNSHNAALAHLEAGVLECFCVPWMPSTTTIDMLSLFGHCGPWRSGLRGGNLRHFRRFQRFRAG